MNRAARMVTTRTGITIGLLYQAPPPRPGHYAECVQRALLQEKPQRKAPLLVRVMRALATKRPAERRKQQPCPPFMCAGHRDCADTHCAGRIYGLHHTDGGHEFRDGVAWPIEKQRTGATS